MPRTRHVNKSKRNNRADRGFAANTCLRPAPKSTPHTTGRPDKLLLVLTYTETSSLLRQPN